MKKCVTLFLNRLELRLVERSFRKNNNISQYSDEKYIKYFKRYLGNFIAGNKLLSNSPNIKRFLLQVIKNNFVYYSEQSIDDYLKETSEEMISLLEFNSSSLNDCYISYIANKDTAIVNSSEELMIKFRKILNVQRNMITTMFDECINNEHFYQTKEKELCNKKKENPFNKFLDKQIEKHHSNYEKKVIELKDKISKKLSSKKYLIFVDDYSGSGVTIVNYFSMLEKYINTELEIILICIHSMEKSEEKIKTYFEQSLYKKFYFFTNKINPISRRKYFDKKKNPLRKELLRFEKKHFGDQFALGFQATESLVATYETCPNNTFSSFWFSENSNWSPLFKRSRKQSDALNKLNISKNELIYEVKTALFSRGVSQDLMRQVIILLCVKIFNDETSTRVDIEIEERFYYNKDKLQEYINDRYVFVKTDSMGSSKYALTFKGKEVLKKYQLSHITSFKKLISKNNVFNSNDAIDSRTLYEKC